MRARLPALIVLAALLAVPAPAAAKPKRLPAFRSCSELVAYASRHAPRPVAGPPLRNGVPSAPESGASEDAGDTSETNVQEAGVDEPDMVKTDGTTIFVLSGGALHAIAADGGQPRRLDSLKLDAAEFGATMFLRHGRVFVLGGTATGARIVEVDARDPARLAVLRTQAIEGTIEDARLTGRTARIVVSSIPDALFGETAQRRHARGWLPETAFRSRRSGRRTSGKAVACRAVRRPAAFSGTGVLTVLTVDLARGLPAVDADAVFTSGETVYASATSLYVATQRWESEARTSLHRFDTSDPDSTGYAGSANVPGTLLNQFSLSEHDGVLRAATTLGDESESVVTTLAVRPDGLAARGQVRGLGRGERIYAVRFMGPTGYVVTFRQVDPLYTLDLSDPDRPRAVGELKIPGYSAYLHPVAEGLLLGVGQDATSAGRVQGLQLSLFDVSNPASPRRLHQLKLAEEWSSSTVEWDHHAFLWWPDARLAVLPVDAETFHGAAGFRVDAAQGIAAAGRIQHGPDTSIERALVVRGLLYTVSPLGVRASALDTLADLGWAAFPDPPEPPRPVAVP